MKFNSKFAMGFIVGYYAFGELARAILYQDNYYLVHAIIGLALTIGVGLLGGNNEN